MRTPINHEDFPYLDRSIIDTYNTSIIDYHKGRKSLDFDFLKAHALAEARVMLEFKKKQNPGQPVSWPDKCPVIGFVPNK